MGKRTTQKEEDFKRFLKERGLTRSFKTYQRVKRIRKIEKEVLLSNYDGTSRRRLILVIKEKNRTVIREKATLKVIGRSRKRPKDVIKAIFSQAQDKKKFKVDDWDVKNRSKRNEVQLKNQVTSSSYNKTLQRLRKVTITNKPPARFGFAVVDATYISTSGIRRRVQARSSKTFNLKQKSQQSKAIDGAIYNGAAVAGFSPLEVIIHGYWFETWRDEFVKLKRVA